MTAIPFSRTGYANFEEMYRTERSFVFYIVRRRVGNQAVADDLTQDTFMRVLRNIDTYVPQENKQLRASFKSWIRTIARNVAINYSERRNLEQSHSYKGESISGEYNLSNAEDLLQSKEGLEKTMQAIRSIADPGKREIARLWFMEDRRYKEISAELDIPIGTVMSRLHRTKEDMRVSFYKHE